MVSVIFPCLEITLSKYQILHTRLLFLKQRECVALSLTVFLWKKLLRNIKQMILCSLTKEFLFPSFGWGEIERQLAERKNYCIYKLIFGSIVFLKPVFINSNTICLRPSKIL